MEMVMEVGQLPNTDFALTIEISTLFTLIAKVETAILPQLNAYTSTAKSSAELAKNIMM
jgi:hypothetical protein